MLIATDSRRTEPTISIVIPAKNEQHNLSEILPHLPSVHEVILVDGGSTDRTVEVARETLPGILVVQQTRTGKGNALACGFAAATGDIIVMFDADGSADPDEIPLFVTALLSGADFAKGTRRAFGGGSEDLTKFRSAGNSMLGFLANRMLGTRYTDLCYGYNAFWSTVLCHLDLPDHRLQSGPNADMLWGDGFEIETMINCRIAAADLSVVEVGSLERLRIHGESHLNAVKDGFRVLRTLRTEHRRTQQLRNSRGAVTAAAVNLHLGEGLAAANAGKRVDTAASR